MAESGAGWPLSMIESDGIVVAGDGVPQAKTARQAIIAGKSNFFMIFILMSNLNALFNFSARS